MPFQPIPRPYQAPVTSAPSSHLTRIHFASLLLPSLLQAPAAAAGPGNAALLALLAQQQAAADDVRRRPLHTNSNTYSNSNTPAMAEASTPDRPAAAAVGRSPGGGGEDAAWQRAFVRSYRTPGDAQRRGPRDPAQQQVPLSSPHLVLI